MALTWKPGTKGADRQLSAPQWLAEFRPYRAFLNEATIAAGSLGGRSPGLKGREEAMQNWGVLPPLLLLAACGPIQSAQVADQINGMIGLSEERVLSCMGSPTTRAQSGSTNVWTYDTTGAVTSTGMVSGNRSFAVGSVTTNQELCHINLTLQNGMVVAANYRSQGKLLSPSLPCYSVLHACVPDPTAAAAARQNVSNNSKEAVDFCKELYKDPRLDPLREAIAFAEPPSLSMQSNSAYVTDEQRTALDVYGGLFQQCRNKISAASPQVWRILVQVNPNPTEDLKNLYDRKITLGQYNTRRQEIIDKFQAAIAGQQK
jgi:hypothetical protein